MKKFLTFAIALFISVISTNTLAQNCYITKTCFAIKEPYLIEKTCYLYFHEVDYNRYQEGRTAKPDVELDSDFLHAEFVKMLLEKTYISLKKGMQVFDCGYDLSLVTQNYEQARMKGANLPEFQCKGFLYRFVPVRVVNANLLLGGSGEYRLPRIDTGS